MLAGLPTYLHGRGEQCEQQLPEPEAGQQLVVEAGLGRGHAEQGERQAQQRRHQQPLPRLGDVCVLLVCQRGLRRPRQRGGRQAGMVAL